MFLTMILDGISSGGGGGGTLAGSSLTSMPGFYSKVK
jgi:hypothetical protein